MIGGSDYAAELAAIRPWKDRASAITIEERLARIEWARQLIWAIGTMVGVASIRGRIMLTGLPALDSALGTAIGFIAACLLLVGLSPKVPTPQ